MDKHPDQVAQARVARLANTWNANPLIADIFQALLDFGGSAHCHAVADQIAWRRARGPASAGLRREVIEAFDMHLSKASERGLPALMERPFGEGSLRWALTPKVRQFVDSFRTADGSLADAMATLSRNVTPRQADSAKVHNLADRKPRAARTNGVRDDG